MSGGFKETTNNRMELLAVIEGLEALKETCRVTLFSDSRYVVDAMSKGWAKRWRANKWQRNSRERAVNPDLWERLLVLAEKHDVEFKWVRDTAGSSRTSGSISWQRPPPTNGICQQTKDIRPMAGDRNRLTMNERAGNSLTHLDAEGAARMVDVATSR